MAFCCTHGTNRVQDHTASASPATGFFLHALPHAVYVKRWNSTTESLEALPEAEAERFAAGVRRFDFDAGMAPYNLHGLDHEAPSGRAVVGLH
ncbi:hypothetical protein V8C86DRAFT_2571083 [Haematococcus lacustris]